MSAQTHRLIGIKGVDFSMYLGYNCHNMAKKTQYLSEEKYHELEAELAHLKVVERKKNAEDLEYAKSLGDLSENAEYHEASERKADMEDRIADGISLKNSQIVKSHHSGQVEVGTTVTVDKNGQAETYQIVGAEEADMAAGKISYESPLGSALLGYKKGEEVAVVTPKGKTKYKIVDIK